MRSYSLFDVGTFPTADSFETALQEQLVWTPPTTRFTLVRDLEAIGFLEYEVQHYSRVRFRGVPYHHQTPIDEVTEAHRFSGYLARDRSYMLLRYGKRIAREAADRLSRLETPIQAQRPRLDLKALLRKARFQRLYGTYFSDITVPHVRSSALFGPDVDDSEFFDVFSRLGDLSAIITEVELDHEALRILVTRDFTIGFYRDVAPTTQLAVISELKPILDSVRIEKATLPTRRRAGRPSSQMDSIDPLQQTIWGGGSPH